MLERLSRKIFRKFRSREPDPSVQYQIDFSGPEFHLDGVSVEAIGLVQLYGWSPHRDLSAILLPQCRVSGEDIPRFQVFRTYRPDVAAAFESDNSFQGFCIVYRLKPSECSGPIQILLRDEILLEIRERFQFIEPHYAGLLDLPAVLHREHIYSSGPPSVDVSPEIVELCKNLPGPLLDFGCGTGVLVKTLRDKGIEAYGIELNREPITAGVLKEVSDYVTLSEGTFPLPFSDGQFSSAVAIEVIEHLPQFEIALSELARVTRDHLIVTVPDMSSVPLGFPHNVVPWHLLEATHVNFFNQNSLETTLRKYFPRVEMARVGQSSTNGTTWFVSVAGICGKE